MLVDEFQDLSPVQYGVVRQLAEGHRNLFGVGDDEQAIFSWAGSDPHIIHRFRDDFGLTHPIVLDRNCRCSVQIFDAAKRLIACNPRLFEKQIEATRDSRFDVQVEGFDSDEDEVAWLIEDMRRDQAEHGGWVGGHCACCIGPIAWGGTWRSGWSAPEFPAGWPRATLSPTTKLSAG